MARGNLLHLQGEALNLKKCEQFFSFLELANEQGFLHGKYDFLRFLEKVSSGKTEELEALLNNPLRLQIRNLWFKKSWSAKFLDLILKNDLVELDLLVLAKHFWL